MYRPSTSVFLLSSPNEFPEIRLPLFLNARTSRRSISSFLDQSQMAFPLTLAMGCSLTLGGGGGRKERHSKPGENFMDCAMATGFCSGFRHPPFALPFRPSFFPFLRPIFPRFFYYRFGLDSRSRASSRLLAKLTNSPRNFVGPGSNEKSCVSLSLSLSVSFRFVRLLSIKTILPDDTGYEISRLQRY